jgi:hypothetical protein
LIMRRQAELFRWHLPDRSFAPAGAGHFGRLRPTGWRAGARGYILSPLTGLVYDRLSRPFSSRRGLGQAFLAAGGGNQRQPPAAGRIAPTLSCESPAAICRRRLHRHVRERQRQLIRRPPDRPCVGRPGLLCRNRNVTP